MSIEAMKAVWEAEPGVLKRHEVNPLLVIANAANREGEMAWPRIEEVAKKCRISRRQAQYTIRALEKRGIITRSKRLGKEGRQTSNYYAINLDKLAARGAVHCTPEKTSRGEVDCTGEGEVHCTPPVQPIAPQEAKNPIYIAGAGTRAPLETTKETTYPLNPPIADTLGSRPARQNQEAEPNGRDEDPLYDQAVAIVVENQRASVSLLQRRLGIHYYRAAGLIDVMSERGVVGPARGSSALRDVLPAADLDVVATAEAERIFVSLFGRNGLTDGRELRGEAREWAPLVFKAAGLARRGEIPLAHVLEMAGDIREWHREGVVKKRGPAWSGLLAKEWPEHFGGDDKEGVTVVGFPSANGGTP